MKSGVLFLSVLAFAVFGNIEARAMPIDLSDGWVAEGDDGVWVVQPGDNSVLQTVNGFPTVFHNNTNSQGMQLSGTIQVQPFTLFDDDDYIGFVLGYNAGDLSNPNPDYLVIDWKQGTQTFGNCSSDSLMGLSVTRVTGPINDFGQSACRDGTGGVTELARGATLGATGWEDLVVYNFDLIFTPTRVQVLVNGILEINLSGSFSDGSFGFYNSSQEQVLYAGITEDIASPVPDPGTLALLSIGLFGIGLTRRRRKT